MSEPYDAKLDLWSVGCIFKEMLEAAGVADTRKKVGFAARKVRPSAPRELFRSVAVTCPLRHRYITAT